MLDLYVMETCPFCRRVIEFLENAGVDFNKRDVSNSENHKRLLEIGGKDQVPFLADENIKMYESSDIIEYIKKKFA